MFDLQHPRRSFVLASLCISMIAAPLGCSSYVEYEGSDAPPPSNEQSTRPCLSSSPPPECHTTCNPSQQTGSPCSLEGQQCTRQEGECQFHAVCDGVTWVGTFNCMGGPPLPPPECLRCIDFLSTPTPGAVLCPESEKVFFELNACACQRGVMDPIPGCKEACSDNFCVSSPDKASMECISCVQNQFCQDALNACLNGI